MSNLTTLQARIAEEISRDDLATEIAAAITQAIRRYEGERFVFNERRYTLATVAGTEYYAWTSLVPEAGGSLGTDETLLEIDSVTATVNGETYQMRERSHNWINDHQRSASLYTGQPDSHCVYADQLRLYPVPDAVYTLTFSALARLPTLSEPSDSNGWTQDGQDLITGEVKVRLFRDSLRDPDGLAGAKEQRDEAYASLKRRYNAKATAAGIRPWGA